MTSALFLCADWSARSRGRKVWAADVGERVVFPLAGERWTASAVIDEADELRGDDPAIVAFDAPLGLPRAYLEAAGASSFADWLASAPFETLFVPGTGPDDWSPQRPFVRPVRGGWTGVVAAAGPDLLWRSIDRATGAESVFKLIGPKQVGRAAQELWRELRDARSSGREFAVWPFETALDGTGVVVAEIYPRLAYADLVGPARFVKTDRASRAAALANADPRIRVREVGLAAATDDDFDAAVTAVALLRRALDAEPLVDEGAVDPRYEGGILLA